jgi:hypothetical protein
LQALDVVTLVVDGLFKFSTEGVIASLGVGKLSVSLLLLLVEHSFKGCDLTLKAGCVELARSVSISGVATRGGVCVMVRDMSDITGHV